MSASPRRMSLEEPWADFEAEGIEMPRKADGTPYVPAVMPRRDDPKPFGYSIFRNLVDEADLDGFTLPRTFMGRSTLRGVNFRNTDLTESRMCWNDFFGCDFRDADLSGCDLRSSRFEECNFAGATLRGADLRAAYFDDCDFTGADLTGAHLVDQDETIEITEDQRRSIVWHEEPGPDAPGQ